MGDEWERCGFRDSTMQGEQVCADARNPCRGRRDTLSPYPKRHLKNIEMQGITRIAIYEQQPLLGLVAVI